MCVRDSGVHLIQRSSFPLQSEVARWLFGKGLRTKQRRVTRPSRNPICLTRRPDGFLNGRRQAKATETGCRPIPLYSDLRHTCRTSPLLRELPRPVFSEVRHDLCSPSLSMRVLTRISPLPAFRLWHQITLKLAEFFDDPLSQLYQVDVYDRFVRDFAAKLNPLKLVEMGVKVSRQIDSA